MGLNFRLKAKLRICSTSLKEYITKIVVDSHDNCGPVGVFLSLSIFPHLSHAASFSLSLSLSLPLSLTISLSAPWAYVAIHFMRKAEGTTAGGA